MSDKITQRIFEEDAALLADNPPEVETPKEEAQHPRESSNILDLPSRGRLGYPSSITYRDILVKDEEILSTATQETYARVLNQVLKTLCNDCEFFDDLTTIDRDYILVFMWAYNYSPTKRVELSCPACKHEFNHLVDFTKHEVTDINEKFKGYYAMTTRSGVDIRVRLNTVGDEDKAELLMSRNKAFSDKFNHLMMCQSIEFDGCEIYPLENRVKWVEENISGKEMAKIRKFHSMLRYGIDPLVEYKCPECSEAFQSPFPFSAEDILFPTVSADIEEFL